MTSLENVERIIEEWFDDYITIDGIKGIIKLYAKITNERDCYAQVYERADL